MMRGRRRLASFPLILQLCMRASQKTQRLTFAFMCTHTFTCTLGYTHIECHSMFVCVCVCLCLCVCVCVYIYIYIYMYMSFNVCIPQCTCVLSSYTFVYVRYIVIHPLLNARTLEHTHNECVCTNNKANECEQCMYVYKQ